MHAAEIEKNTVTDDTHKYRKMVSWLEGVDLNNKSYLDGFEISEKVRLVAGFAIIIYQCKYKYDQYKGSLISGMVDKGVSILFLSFQYNNKPNPGLSVNEKHRLLPLIDH